jgi:predicted secreted protein
VRSAGCARRRGRLVQVQVILRCGPGQILRLASYGEAVRWRINRNVRYRPLVVVSALAALAALAACSTTAASPPEPASASPDRTRPAGAPAVARAASRPVPAQTTVTRVRTADGAVVTVARFAAPDRYVLHDGSWDPASRYSRLVNAGRAVGAAERQQLVAAFNGGFLMSSHAGGYEQETHVFKKLLPGLASLVIDRSGHARIAVWGVTAPARGEAVYSVRQNLWPLVLNGQPTAEAALWWRWGGTNSHAALDPRSALGQDAAGGLMYAESASATPQDMAGALARSGALIAMELDINGNLQLDIARTAGGALSAADLGQRRPASQYLTGWTRDFITVLAP